MTIPIVLPMSRIGFDFRATPGAGAGRNSRGRAMGMESGIEIPPSKGNSSALIMTDIDVISWDCQHHYPSNYIINDQNVEHPDQGHDPISEIAGFPMILERRQKDVGKHGLHRRQTNYIISHQNWRRAANASLAHVFAISRIP